MKIVINKCYGGFGLSEEATLLYGKKKGLNIIVQRDKGLKINHYYLNEKKDGNYFSEGDIQRNDPALIEIVEELGIKANGFCSPTRLRHSRNACFFSSDFVASSIVVTLGTANPSGVRYLREPLIVSLFNSV